MYVEFRFNKGIRSEITSDYVEVKQDERNRTKQPSK